MVREPYRLLRMSHREIAMPRGKTAPDGVRFWKHVNKDGPVHPTLGTACWVWTSTVDVGGYGLFHIGSRKTNDRRGAKAHRWVFEQTHGCTLKDRWDMVLHKCDNRKCVNPEHLFRGTHQENMKDRDVKKRQAHGSRHGMSELTDDQVRHVLARKSWGEPETLKQLAARFGVSLPTLIHIRSGHTWKHLQTPDAAPPAESSD